MKQTNIGKHLNQQLANCKFKLNKLPIFNFFLTFRGIKTKVQVFPGGTDSRYLRSVGIPAIGFSPMNYTPVLLHDHDEFLQADIFLKGIEIYTKIIASVADA
jgi:acetylornithine deacetylase/succinyl-diaminopimelate desuccinylase-like protein